MLLTRAALSTGGRAKSKFLSVEISASNLEPAWVYELQGITGSTLPWDNLSGSLRSNATVAVWTNTPLPGEPTIFFRVIKRD